MNNESTWFAHDISVSDEEQGKVYDPESGNDLLVRSFKILTDPTKQSDPQEILEYHRPKIMDMLYRDGWTLERELVIGNSDKPNLYDIIAVCRVSEKHGSLVGVQNDKTKNVSEILIKEKEAQA